MRKWELDIGVEEVTIRGWPDGPFIYARARQGHPVVSGEDWQFIVDALNAAEEQREEDLDAPIFVQCGNCGMKWESRRQFYEDGRCVNGCRLDKNRSTLGTPIL